jgi:hypothetical protein
MMVQICMWTQTPIHGDLFLALYLLSLVNFQKMNVYVHDYSASYALYNQLTVVLSSISKASMAFWGTVFPSWIQVSRIMSRLLGGQIHHMHDCQDTNRVHTLAKEE